MKIKLIDFGLVPEHSPHRLHANDAGADVYIPFDCTLKPGEIIKVPLGFGLELPDGYAGFVFPCEKRSAPNRDGPLKFRNHPVFANKYEYCAPTYAVPVTGNTRGNLQISLQFPFSEMIFRIGLPLSCTAGSSLQVRTRLLLLLIIEFFFNLQSAICFSD